MSRTLTCRLSAIRPFARTLCGAVAVTGLVAACHVEHVTPQTASAQSSDPALNFENKSFDPKAQVVDIWSSKVIPAIAAKAGNFPDVQAALKSGADAAGARFGYRERGEGAPWILSTRLKGRIVAVDTESSASTVDVDVDGDGKADAHVQIGPIIRGTAIRDALPFISFTNYTNQVEFAQLANAFNDQAFKLALKPLKRDALKGRSVELLGVFSSEPGDDDLPVITPVQLTLGGA